MSPVQYAHPDGYLRQAGTGALGARWDGAAFAYGDDRAATISRAGLVRSTTSVVEGNLVITADGQTYSDVLVRGWIEDRANNTILDNVRCEVGAALMSSYSPPTQAGIFAIYDKTGGIYRNIEIAPTNPTVDTYGIIGSGYELYDASIVDVVDFLQINKPYLTTVRGGHFRNGRWYSYDPRQVDGSHGDGFQIIMGGLDARGPVIDTGIGPVGGRVDGDNSTNFAIIATQNSSTYPITQVTVDKAWCTGFTYSAVKIEEKGRGTIPVSITSTRFEQDAQNAIIHGSAPSINAATITGNTGPDGNALSAAEINADSGVA